MLETIRTVIINHNPELDPDILTPEADFYLDLEWTSLDLVGCITDLEDATGKVIPDDRLGDLHTLGELAALLEGL